MTSIVNAHDMKSSSVLILGLVLVGCASSKPRQVSLSDGQATVMARQLANKQATLLYNCQPFHDGQPANFTNGHWHWTELCSGDYEANVELAANGSTNRVKVYWLWDRLSPNGLPGGPMGLPGGVGPRFRSIP
jgi:hypothetical protein